MALLKKKKKKKMLNLSKNWFSFNYDINTKKLLIDDDIVGIINKFWSEIITNINDNESVLLLVKIKFNEEMGWKSIIGLQSINKDSKESLIEVIKAKWSISNNEYKGNYIDKMCIIYKKISTQNNIINDGKLENKRLESENKEGIIKIKNLSAKKKSKENMPKFKFYGVDLPNTMNLEMWGSVHYYDGTLSAIVYKTNSKLEYHVSIFDTFHKVELKNDNKVVVTFKDTKLNGNDLTTFRREIKNQEYYFENCELKLKKLLRKTEYLKPIKRSIYRTGDFISMDLETRNINGIMSPYCVSIYDGKNVVSFYLSDYKDSNDMLKNSIIYLMKRKYNGYRVYLHNFSNFDGIFLLRVMTELSNHIQPIIKDGRFINIKFSFGKYNIYFRDSYLLLPFSLSNLSKSFNVDKKSIFPYFFVNNVNIHLNYEGKVPTYNYFTKITEEEYSVYCKDFLSKSWNLKNEVIKYCNQDVITLHQIINKFSIEIFDLFRLDIVKYPTLSSLAFAIYRSNFLKRNKIPLITRKDIFNDFKEGYTGGSVDVYKPHGKNVYYYDVNSLYPYVMKNCFMPVGYPTYFEGNILKYEKEPFGFFEVEIQAPEDLKNPLLQVRIDTKNGKRTIAPLGNWTGFYFSEEIYNTMKMGYTFNVLRGYQFKKDIIFNEYVDVLYDLKVKNIKNSTRYIIAKLLLNSLYGRFGMNLERINHVIVNESEAIKYYNEFKVIDVLILENGKEIISYVENINDEEELNHLNISIPIASAITAYARNYMSMYKNLQNIQVLYTDTDSIATDKKLDDKDIGSEIGLMKLEYKFDEVLFLAPKVYGGVIFSIEKNIFEEIIKVKGLKNNSLRFKDLLPLKNRNNSLKISNEKWYKNIEQGNISIKNEIYTLIMTDNKRKIIYDNNNQFVDTKAFKLENGVIKDI
jgi:hypothetical protein